MRVLSLTVLAAALLTTPALASQLDKTGEPAKEKKVCRSEMPTGSYITKRTCHTADEWKAIDNANANTTRAMRDRVGQPTGNGRPM